MEGENFGLRTGLERFLGTPKDSAMRQAGILAYQADKRRDVSRTW